MNELVEVNKIKFIFTSFRRNYWLYIKMQCTNNFFGQYKFETKMFQIWALPFCPGAIIWYYTVVTTQDGFSNKVPFPTWPKCHPRAASYWPENECCKWSNLQQKQSMTARSCLAWPGGWHHRMLSGCVDVPRLPPICSCWTSLKHFWVSQDYDRLWVMSDALTVSVTVSLTMLLAALMEL